MKIYIYKSIGCKNWIDFKGNRIALADQADWADFLIIVWILWLQNGYPDYIPAKWYFLIEGTLNYGWEVKLQRLSNT